MDGLLRFIIPTYWSVPAERPSYNVKVKHAYDVGGFDIVKRAFIELDPLGLEWVKTITLQHRKLKYAFTIMEPEDMDVLGVGRHPTREELP